MISNWEDSPYDLRRRHLGIAGAVRQVVVSDETAAALRGLRLLDPDSERLVLGIRSDHDDAVLLATDEELEELTIRGCRSQPWPDRLASGDGTPPSTRRSRGPDSR